jgi:DNA processing protein
MSSPTRLVSEETQATLLLCAPLLAAKQKGEAPLSIGEFHRLTTALRQMGVGLGDLLGAKAGEVISGLPMDADRGRIEGLLGRGFLMSLALEKWAGMALWVLGRSDEQYPKRLRDRLGPVAPPLLYGCGEVGLLEKGGVAIVGSRDVDEAGSSFTKALAERCAEEGLMVISGGAKGVDQIAMRAAADNGGTVTGVLGADLARAVMSGNARELIGEKRVTMISPFDPEAGFNVGNAMARNKVIYALADYGVVVSSGEKEGGTWAGAVEQLEKFKQVPLLVRSGEDVPSGNEALIKMGGLALPGVPRNVRPEFDRLALGRKQPVEMLLAL